MAYQVNKFNGVLQTTVADGTIDSSTDLRFVGKNYAGYGEVQNENFLYLMENFANTTAPPKAVNGQIWYDSGNKRLKFYDKDASKWKVAGGAEVGISQPAGLQAGEFWWDSSAQQLYAWSGTQYVLVGPAASPELGSSAITTDTIKDNKTPVADTHAVIKIIAGGEIVAIVNALEDFVPSNASGLAANFPIIKQGITLINTPANGETTSDYRFWGTASNADQLGGRDAADYVVAGVSNPFSSAITFPDAGFFVGTDADLKIFVFNGEDVTIENQRSTPINFKIGNGITSDKIVAIDATGLVPGTGAVYNLGTSAKTWNTVYAATIKGNINAADDTSAYNTTTKVFTGSFVGNLVSTDSTVLVNATTNIIGGEGIEHRGNFIGAFQGDLDGTSSDSNALVGNSPSTSATANSIAQRDSSGNITANQFVGVADKVNRMIINDSATDPTFDAGIVSTQYRSAKTTKTALSIAARDSLGDLWANTFHGVATSAQYADLAEKYLTDKEYAPGTVVMIGGEAEVTAADVNTRAIGVVSTNPAFKMNSELEGGTYIALKGRVPVKVYGAVRKGDRLVAGPSGAAIAAHGNYANVFAVALETSGNEDVKIIEAVIL